VKLKTPLSAPLDRVREYWNNRPCNIFHSKKEFLSKEYFDEVEQRKYFVEPHLPEFADFSSVKGKTILEIGCGMGTTTISFAKAGAKKITAVDLSEKSIEIAKKRAEIFGFENIEFYHANAEELSKVVPLEKYDLIFSFGVIHHTEHPEKIIKALRPYLSEAGKLKIMVYYRYSWKVFWIFLKHSGGKFWELSKHVAKFSEACIGCPITYTYSRRQARDLIQANGFKVVSLMVDHIFPYRIQDYTKHLYRKVWYFRWMPKFMFRFLEKTLGWHLCITAVCE